MVSQLHRSPGVFFDHDKGRTHATGKLLYSARIIPYRGCWLDFEFDPKDLLYVRIDRRRKLHATVLLRALGYSTEELLNYYYDTETIFLEAGKKYSKSIEYDILPGQRATRDIRHPETREIIVQKNRKFTKLAIRKLQRLGARAPAGDGGGADRQGRRPRRDRRRDRRGAAGVQRGGHRGEARRRCASTRSTSFKVLFIDNLNVGSYLRDTLLADKLNNPEEAIMEIYRRLRPAIRRPRDGAQDLFNNLFFNPERYDLSKVGRLKLNYKFKVDEPLDNCVLTKRDILETVRYLIELKNGRGSIDDIDHLGNRRVRAVGELMENQYRIGLVRMERAIKERMSMSQEIETLMPHDLINAKPVSAVVKEYFGSSQLVAVHGPDQPAVRGDAQAAPVGPGAGRPDPRARGLRGARRARDPLRPHLPHRDAGRAEHRPDRLAVDLCPGQRVRLHRDALPQGRGRQWSSRGQLLLGAGGGGARHRPGQRRPRQARASSPSELVSARHNGDFVMVRPEDSHPDGRLAQPAGLGGRLADSRSSRTTTPTAR